jgi:hypothetical protein
MKTTTTTKTTVEGTFYGIYFEVYATAIIGLSMLMTIVVVSICM